MRFFIDIEPPTVTAQQKGESVIGGRIHHFEKRKVTAAREVLRRHLYPHAPDEPILGPVALRVHWAFATKSHKEGEWRITRPDTDNLQKLLKDCMTDVGFWKDDSQVCVERVSKSWSRKRLGIEIEVAPISRLTVWEDDDGDAE